MIDILSNTNIFRDHLYTILKHEKPYRSLSVTKAADLASVSSVLFLVGMWPNHKKGKPEPSLIINKRSSRVRQPGDLCCPGGGVSERLDSILAKLLILPFFPLSKWPYWPYLRAKHPALAIHFAQLVATGLREGFEEMRLNPLGIGIMGILPVQRLVMFDRLILPIVCWISHRKQFYHNREVEKVIVIPFRDLVNTENYARYRLEFKLTNHLKKNGEIEDFPSFIYQDSESREFLWGATYRITISFLQLVFNFSPPELQSLPIVNGTIQQAYLTGQE